MQLSEKPGAPSSTDATNTKSCAAYCLQIHMHTCAHIDSCITEAHTDGIVICEPGGQLWSESNRQGQTEKILIRETDRLTDRWMDRGRDRKRK